MDNVTQRAEDSGKIRTLLGRLCRFHLWEPNQFGIHKALPHDASTQRNTDQGSNVLTPTRH